MHQRTYSVHRYSFADCLVLPHFTSRRLQAYIILTLFCLQGCNSTEDLLKFWGIFRCAMATVEFWLQAKLVQSTSPGGPVKLSWYSDSLRAGRSGDRIPVEARFSELVHTGPGAHPAPYTMGTVSFPGIKRPGCDVDHTPPASADVKERVELYLYSPSGPLWSVLG